MKPSYGENICMGCRKTCLSWFTLDIVRKNSIVESMILCRDCVTRKPFLYIDETNTVKYNRTCTTHSSTLLE
jgi:hypothetical protein